MKLYDIRATLERTNGHRAQHRGSVVMLEGLKANDVDETETSRRVRQEARRAEDRVLEDIIYNIKAVGWLNQEIHDAAVRLVQIERTMADMHHYDSSQALHSTHHVATAAQIELTTLRTAMLRTVIASASALAPHDGYTSWGDTPSNSVFPSGTETFGEIEADPAEVLTDSFDRARANAAKQGQSITDEELAQLLGVI